MSASAKNSVSVLKLICLNQSLDLWLNEWIYFSTSSASTCIDSVLEVITLLAQRNLGPAIQFEFEFKTLNGKQWVQ